MKKMFLPAIGLLMAIGALAQIPQDVAARHKMKTGRVHPYSEEGIRERAAIERQQDAQEARNEQPASNASEKSGASAQKQNNR